MALAQKAFASSSSRMAVRPVRVSREAAVCVQARESRIGRKPIPVPKGVTVTLDPSGLNLKVKGPKGELERTFLPAVKLENKDGNITVSRVDQTKTGMDQWGLSRTLANNMVVGVSEGYETKLELVGTGFRASTTKTELTLNVGYCKPRIVAIPPGISVAVDKSTNLTISGYDKIAVGDFCAYIRKQRPPEPYKGKGVRFAGEVIKLKEGKAGGKK